MPAVANSLANQPPDVRLVHGSRTEISSLWLVAHQRPKSPPIHGIAANKNEIYNFFIQEVRRNLHVVLCFSPVGDAIRTRLRKFPSLITCMTINWFSAWPEDALNTVARAFLTEVELVADDEVANAAMQQKLATMCVFFHSSVQRTSER